MVAADMKNFYIWTALVLVLLYTVSRVIGLVDLREGLTVGTPGLGYGSSGSYYGINYNRPNYGYGYGYGPSDYGYDNNSGTDIYGNYDFDPTYRYPQAIVGSYCSDCYEADAETCQRCTNCELRNGQCYNKSDPWASYYGSYGRYFNPGYYYNRYIVRTDPYSLRSPLRSPYSSIRNASNARSNNTRNTRSNNTRNTRSRNTR